MDEAWMRRIEQQVNDIERDFRDEFSALHAKVDEAVEVVQGMDEILTQILDRLSRTCLLRGLNVSSDS